MQSCLPPVFPARYLAEAYDPAGQTQPSAANRGDLDGAMNLFGRVNRGCGIPQHRMAFVSLMVLLAGCEYRPLYGIELIDFDGDEQSTIVERAGHRLVLSVSSSAETPGITIVATDADTPETPPWDWEDFRSWPTDRQASVYDEYYDRKYRELSVSQQSPCPLWIEDFDQRDSAREAAFGRWLNGLPDDNPSEHPKGIFVGIPVSGCESRPAATGDDTEQFTLRVDSEDGGPAETTVIRFRVYLVERQIRWPF